MGTPGVTDESPTPGTPDQALRPPREHSTDPANNMRTRATVTCFAMRNFEHTRARFVQRLTSTRFSATRALMPPAVAEFAFAPRASGVASRAPASPPAIYVVDDLPHLTELYAALL